MPLALHWMPWKRNGGMRGAMERAQELSLLLATWHRKSFSGELAEAFTLHNYPLLNGLHETKATALIFKKSSILLA